MIAYDLKVLGIELIGGGYEDEYVKASDKEWHYDWTVSHPDVTGRACFRITPEMRAFLLLCHKSQEIIGFEYDFEEGGKDFNLILGDKKG